MKWIGPTQPACYPTRRFVPSPGCRLEVEPLTFGRGRIVSTDGISVEAFW